MLITRTIDQSICVNHQLTLTVQELTDERVMLFVENAVDGTEELVVLELHQEYQISEYGTRLWPDLIDVLGVTFTIQHDPQVIVHRAESGEMN